MGLVLLSVNGLLTRPSVCRVESLELFFLHRHLFVTLFFLILTNYLIYTRWIMSKTLSGRPTLQKPSII